MLCYSIISLLCLLHCHCCFAKMLWIFWVKSSTQTQLTVTYTNWFTVFCPGSNISHFRLDPGAKSCLLEQQEQQELMSVTVPGNDVLGNPSCRGSAVRFLAKHSMKIMFLWRHCTHLCVSLDLPSKKIECDIPKDSFVFPLRDGLSCC